MADESEVKKYYFEFNEISNKPDPKEKIFRVGPFFEDNPPYRYNGVLLRKDFDVTLEYSEVELPPGSKIFHIVGCGSHGGSFSVELILIKKIILVETWKTPAETSGEVWVPQIRAIVLTDFMPLYVKFGEKVFLFSIKQYDEEVPCDRESTTHFYSRSAYRHYEMDNGLFELGLLIKAKHKGVRVIDEETVAFDEILEESKKSGKLFIHSQTWG